MPITCIAIDDDPTSLESLIEYIENSPDLELIKTFAEPLQALSEISASNPVDIIFMDIEMPAISGIELASLLRQKTKHLIFTTAHTRYAIDAFKVEADAYLLKPYSVLNFIKTIGNLYPNGKKDVNPLTVFEDHYFYIPVQDESGSLIKIDLDELISIENSHQEIQFKTLNKNYVSAKLDLIKMMKMLKKHPAFLQISENIIIAKQHIKSVLGNQVLLSGETSYPIAASHQELFSTFLKSNLLKPTNLPD
ncbi:LytR/AlgR family response regulator transcription factor [Pedobacter rhizosphaerae]|uniref:Two component transcriptional regulator, LytTR family n=1 Tax=Pedobacter rhizosphaerae TaxID=390241 RepID=A0A1H9LZK4_9SPHI|nr:LytTR family DNA-binding domain-containing protein [Pedobacter rhizosphaerae]SER16851.1 two component transcriptional regulator, LytTR family [Pedobacter rhizosphaerae]